MFGLGFVIGIATGVVVMFVASWIVNHEEIRQALPEGKGGKEPWHLKTTTPNWPRCFRRCRTGLKADETGAGNDDIWDVGARLRHAAMGLGGYEQIITDLRMLGGGDLGPAPFRMNRQIVKIKLGRTVCRWTGSADGADAIDPPITSEEEAWIAAEHGRV